MSNLNAFSNGIFIRMSIMFDGFSAWCKSKIIYTDDKTKDLNTLKVTE